MSKCILCGGDILDYWFNEPPFRKYDCSNCQKYSLKETLINCLSDYEKEVITWYLSKHGEQKIDEIGLQYAKQEYEKEKQMPVQA
jgi:hypothetical protein